MLDFNLIEKSVLHIQNVKPKEIIPGLYQIEDFLFPPLLKKLLSFISSNDIPWVSVDDFARGIKSSPRKKINWLSDSVIEETHKVLESYTPFINRFLNKNNIFEGISIWKDTAGFRIRPHTDNPVFDVALQLFLSDNPGIKKATTFYKDNTVYQLDHVQNTGYIIDNRRKIVHSFTEKIPNDDIRFSLHSVWFKKS